ncbi:MAG: hypothetical protein ACI30M_02705 [Muribaculaceae bacterium]
MKKAVIYPVFLLQFRTTLHRPTNLERKPKIRAIRLLKVYEEKESGFVDDRPELAKVLALTKAEIKRLCKDVGS